MIALASGFGRYPAAAAASRISSAVRAFTRGTPRSASETVVAEHFNALARERMVGGVRFTIGVEIPALDIETIFFGSTNSCACAQWYSSPDRARTVLSQKRQEGVVLHLALATSTA